MPNVQLAVEALRKSLMDADKQLAAIKLVMDQMEAMAPRYADERKP